MILTRSPFYKIIPWLRPSDGLQVDKYIFSIRVWTGDIADVPILATYSIEKVNVDNSTGTDKVDFSRLINDFIENTPIDLQTTGLSDGNCAIWVKTQVTYWIGEAFTFELISTNFATNGYTYGIEGENFETSKILLTDTNEIEAHTDSIVLVPILQNDVRSVSITAYPSGAVLSSFSTSNAILSNEVVSMIVVNTTDAIGEKYIVVSVQGSASYTIYLTNEKKFIPNEVQFINRYGASQTVTFFKKRSDSLEVESEEYESSFAQPNIGAHQFQRFNVNGKSSFKLESGYVDESQNVIYKQIALSEKVWVNGVPVNATINSINYKSRVNDKLVNYTLDFENSYNEINTI